MTTIFLRNVRLLQGILGGVALAAAVVAATPAAQSADPPAPAKTSPSVAAKAPPSAAAGVAPQAVAPTSTARKPLPSVMQLLADRARRMGAALPPIPADKALWEVRRAEVRRALARLLGLPAREPMRARVLASRDEGELVVEDVEFLWAERAYVSGNVVRPKRIEGRLPALVVPPGWLGQLPLECYKTFVVHMARRGYVVLFIDDPHVGPRKAPCAGLYGAASAAGVQVMGIQVFDTLRGLDYLLSRRDVDPARIGAAGLCQGSEQTWLAAALDDRFQVAAPVCGTTTYEQWARMPAEVPHDLSDPSPYVAGVLRHTDWDEIDACIAPRPVFIASNSGDIWWPLPGYEKVVASMRRVYGLYGREQAFVALRDLRSHSMTPFIAELAPWIDRNLKALPHGDAPPAASAEPVDPDMSMLRYAQRRIAQNAAALPQTFADRPAWEPYRRRVVGFLREACAVGELHCGPAATVSRASQPGYAMESVVVAQGEGFAAPITLLRREDALPRAAVVLSHDSGQCLASGDLGTFARALADSGCLVAAVEHASPLPASTRHVPNVSSFYGAADTVGRPPMALRVWDDLAAVDCLARRADAAGLPIVAVGLGLGGVDVAIAAALDERIAGLAVVGAITLDAWSKHVAGNLDPLDRIMPVLPEVTLHADWPCVYAAAAPRPLLLVDATDRVNWPQAAYRRVADTATEVYRLYGAGASLTAVPSQSNGGVDEVRRWLDAQFVRPRAK